MFYLASAMTKAGERYDYAIGPGQDLQNFMSNHKAYMTYANMINLMEPPSEADVKSMAGIASGRMFGALDGFSDRWATALRAPTWWLGIATAYVGAMPSKTSPRITAYHFTTETAQAEILSSEVLLPSTDPTIASTKYGPGQYFSTLNPDNIVGFNKAGYRGKITLPCVTFGAAANSIYGNAGTGTAARMTHWIEIDITGVRGVTSPKPGTLLKAGTKPLNLQGRIVRSGKTPFNPANL